MKKTILYDPYIFVRTIVNESSSAIEDSNKTFTSSTIPEILGNVLVDNVRIDNRNTLTFWGWCGVVLTTIILLGCISGPTYIRPILLSIFPVIYILIKLQSNKKRINEKKQLYEKAMKNQETILEIINSHQIVSEERIEYLHFLNIILGLIINQLRD